MLAICPTAIGSQDFFRYMTFCRYITQFVLALVKYFRKNHVNFPLPAAKYDFRYTLRQPTL
jgi:hypothetical protein